MITYNLEKFWPNPKFWLYFDVWNLPKLAPEHPKLMLVYVWWYNDTIKLWIDFIVFCGLYLYVNSNFWFQKSEQVEVHSSFLEPVNLELRLAVFNFLPVFSLIVLDFLKILRASMSILAAMFVTLFNFQDSVLEIFFINLFIKQNLVSFIDLNIFSFVFGLFCCRGWHCF